MKLFVWSPGRCCVLSTALLQTLVIPGAALGRGVSPKRVCVRVYVSVCVLCVARRGCLAQASAGHCVNSYNASKLELYILYLTFKAPISKLTIGFIKNIHLIIYFVCLFKMNCNRHCVRSPA